MKLGIIGKPQSGKTTLFNAAAGTNEAVGDFSYSVHKATVEVPDKRLIKIASLINPKKITYTHIEFLDAPGFKGDGKSTKVLEVHPEIRKQDAFILVVDAFSGKDCDPKTEIRNLIDEMIIIDQASLESNIGKKQKKLKGVTEESARFELDLLKRCLSFVEGEKPLIDMQLTDREEKLLKGYMFLSKKPLLIVLNVSEDDLSRTGEIETRYSNFISPGKRELAVVCAKIEAELMALESEQRDEFLKELGISQSAMEKVINKSYELLGLISFITAGEPEVRAWTIHRGMNAKQAAGVIHSDLEKGFIRAEVTNYDDYIQYTSQAALKAAGKIRLEGKDYIVQDGEVILFRFNI